MILHIALDKVFFLFFFNQNVLIFFSVLHKNICCGTHLKGLKALLMSTHNTWLHREIRKIFVDTPLSCSYGSINIYFIVSCEISVYLVKIKVVSITSEMISYHFTCDWYDLYFHSSLWTNLVFFIVSEVDVTATSDFWTPLTSLFLNWTIKCWYAFF